VSQRDEFLNRLQTRLKCPESWDGMQGRESARFCSQCQCEVVDFAQLTPREAWRRLEATRGKMCARLTHEGGRLVLQLPAAEPLSPSRRTLGKVSPLAATLLGAWLSVGSSEAQTSPPSEATYVSLPETDPDRVPEETAISDTLAGESFKRFMSSLDAQRANPAQSLIFDSATTLDTSFGVGLDLDLSITMGDIAAPPELYLRDRFDMSDLVVSAVAGKSEVTHSSQGFAELETQLKIVRRLKGEPGGGSITYRHSERQSSLDPKFGDPNILKSGDEVVAFLNRVRTYKAGAQPIFERSDYRDGVLRLEEAQGKAYLERTEALAKLEDEGRNRDGFRIADLLDWMVETAVHPLTRSETISEIQYAFLFADLERHEGQEDAPLGRNRELAAEQAGEQLVRVGERVHPSLLGAAIKEAHREQLTAALWATQRLDQSGDCTLFEMVFSWDRQAATSWFNATFRAPEFLDAPFLEWLTSFAQKLGGDEAHSFATSANARWQTLLAFPRSASPLAGMEGDARSSRLAHELMIEFAALLEKENLAAISAHQPKEAP